MPGHTSRPPGHPSILEAVINYRGARRSGIISGISLWPTTRVYRRWFIESIDSIIGGIDLSSRNGVYPLGRSSSRENVKLKEGSRSKGNRKRWKRITPSFFRGIRPVTIDGYNRGRS